MAKREPLKILVFTDKPHPNERTIVENVFQKELSERGNKIFSVMFSRYHDENAKRTNNNSEYYFIPYDDKLPPNILELIMLPNLIDISKQIIEKNDIDIILVRDNKKRAIIGYKLAKKYDLKFVYHMSTYFPNLRGLQFENKKTIKAFINFLLANINKFLNVFERIIKKADLFLPISKYMLDCLDTNIDKKNIRSLSLTAPNKFLHTNVNNTRKNGPRLIYVGQISYNRKLHFLISVLKRVKKEFDGVELHLVGPPQQKGIVDHLKSFAKRKGVLRNLKIVGRVDKDEVPEYISNSDIGLSALPPIKAFRVSSPTKTVEYLSVGIPVVANKEVKDQRDILKESGGGFAVSYDIEDFSEKIIHLLRNPEIGKKMGRKGKKWIKKNRTSEIMAKKLEDEFYKLLSNH